MKFKGQCDLSAENKNIVKCVATCGLCGDYLLDLFLSFGCQFSPWEQGTCLLLFCGNFSVPGPCGSETCNNQLPVGELYGLSLLKMTKVKF